MVDDRLIAANQGIACDAAGGGDLLIFAHHIIFLLNGAVEHLHDALQRRNTVL